MTHPLLTLRAIDAADAAQMDWLLGAYDATRRAVSYLINAQAEANGTVERIRLSAAREAAAQSLNAIAASLIARGWQP